MRIRPSMTVALATATLLVAGGVAYAAVQSVGTAPDPQVVIPASATSTPASSGSHHSAGRADDRAGHDAGDDHGGTRSGSDDPATHDAGDDNGGATDASGSDDAATHDAGDDDGGATSRSGSDDPTPGRRPPRPRTTTAARATAARAPAVAVAVATTLVVPAVDTAATADRPTRCEGPFPPGPSQPYVTSRPCSSMSATRTCNDGR